MARNKLSLVREAIEIQGYILVSVNGQNRECRKITVVDGEWMTNILTRDLDGYVRIKKTKDAIVAKAEWIIANADEIRAERKAKQEAAMRWAQEHFEALTN